MYGMKTQELCKRDYVWITNVLIGYPFAKLLIAEIIAKGSEDFYHITRRKRRSAILGKKLKCFLVFRNLFLGESIPHFSNYKTQLKLG
jgi:hypothetical protein